MSLTEMKLESNSKIRIDFGGGKGRYGMNVCHDKESKTAANDMTVSPAVCA